MFNYYYWYYNYGTPWLFSTAHGLSDISNEKEGKRDATTFDS